jgi:2-amino-4-hydroxy-6-hydroxymethyldihydropteridine diphosphokinase
MNDDKLKYDAYIGLGSNKGDRLGYLKKAIEEISSDENIHVEKISSVYETLPYGNIKQGNFYNAVIKIRTAYSHLELFKNLKMIEKNLGRSKSVKWGPREIDLDLLFFDGIIYSDENLQIPHKGIPNRDFVLIPLNQIAPDFIHPELNQKICDICNNIKENFILKEIPFSK